MSAAQHASEEYGLTFGHVCMCVLGRGSVPHSHRVQSSFVKVSGRKHRRSNPFGTTLT